MGERVRGREGRRGRGGGESKVRGPPPMPEEPPFLRLGDLGTICLFIYLFVYLFIESICPFIYRICLFIYRIYFSTYL